MRAHAISTRWRAPSRSTAARCPPIPPPPTAAGIGAYTAGAVASFAYERRAPLVDTNVARVLRRVFAPRLDVRTTRGQRTLWALAEAVLPRTGRATWTHNQAIMELGALICTARVARCDVCPVSTICRSATGRSRTGVV